MDCALGAKVPSGSFGAEIVVPRPHLAAILTQSSQPASLNPLPPSVRWQVMWLDVLLIPDQQQAGPLLLLLLKLVDLPRSTWSTYFGGSLPAMYPGAVQRCHLVKCANTSRAP